MGKKAGNPPPPGNKKDEFTNFYTRAKWKAMLGKAYLDCNGRNLRKEGTASVAFALCKNKTVTRIDFAHNDIGDEGTTLLAQYLKVNDTIQAVNLACNNITDIGAIALASAFVPFANPTGLPSQWNRSVDQIILAGNQISDDGFQALCMAASFLVELRLIDVTWNKVKGFGCKALFRSMERNKFCNYLLGRNEIGDEGAAHFAAAMKRFGGGGMGFINLWCNGISKGGADALGAMLENNTFVERLNLSYNTLGAPGTEALVKHLMPPYVNVLNDLNLAHNCLDSDGAKEVARLLESDPPSLTRLNISSNKIPDHGGEAIFRAVVKNSHIQHIIAQDNDFGERTAEAIAAAIRGEHGRNLKTINVEKCMKFELKHQQTMSDAKQDLDEELRKEKMAKAQEEATEKGEKFDAKKVKFEGISLRVTSADLDNPFEIFNKKCMEFIDKQEAELEAKNAKGKKGKKKG